MYVNESISQSVSQCATVKSGSVIRDGMKGGFFLMYFRSFQNSCIIKSLVKINLL